MIDDVALEELISAETDEFKKLVRTYVGEAIFFDALIGRDLAERPDVRNVIEVGSGVGLLSLLLAGRGYSVTAFEPESAGFSEMRRIRELVIRAWVGPVPNVRFIDGYLTKNLPDGFVPADIGIAINVIEHVPDFSGFLDTCIEAVGAGREFRFVCPNYVFPYEPHFNFFTFLTKRATWMWKKNAIKNSSLPDPVGMWNELSWITPGKLVRAARSNSLDISFSKRAMRAYVGRPLTDATFVERKGAMGRYVLVPMAKVLRLFLGFVPTRILPIIDVTVKKRTSKSAG